MTLVKPPFSLDSSLLSCTRGSRAFQPPAFPHRYPSSESGRVYEGGGISVQVVKGMEQHHMKLRVKAKVSTWKNDVNS